ncbi:MAG: hypothetical protein M1825_005066 [Sarcosagium campestre]|nr:MAG: hypothetical protein M1825_005066 [Sarcosagium campestre]
MAGGNSTAGSGDPSSTPDEIPATPETGPAQTLAGVFPQAQPVTNPTGPAAGAATGQARGEEEDDGEIIFDDPDPAGQQLLAQAGPIPIQQRQNPALPFLQQLQDVIWCPDRRTQRERMLLQLPQVREAVPRHPPFDVKLDRAVNREAILMH